MTSIKRFLIWALGPVMRLWTWHVLRKARCKCGEIIARKVAEQMGCCGDCYFKLLLGAHRSQEGKATK